jgi:5-formyltetrahydrofolate cyclo-ligase
MAEVERALDTKQELRTAARRARAAAFAYHGSAATEQLAAHGLGFAGIATTAIISGFSAIAEEISPLPLLMRLAREGHALCLPVLPGKGLPLSFRSWSPGDATQAAVWGIQEPLPAAAVLEPDVLLIPLLAFDARGNRLGYGGGFYDRTIARLRAMKPIVTIGIAFDEQRVDSVPHTAYDQRLEWILTPTGPMHCSDI